LKYLIRKLINFGTKGQLLNHSLYNPILEPSTTEKKILAKGNNMSLWIECKLTPDRQLNVLEPVCPLCNLHLVFTIVWYRHSSRCSLLEYRFKPVFPSSPNL